MDFPLANAMGCISIAATLSDEAEFLAFLRSLGEIQLLSQFAPTRDEIWVREFDPEPQLTQSYLIWNSSISWTPDIQPYPNWRGPISHRFHVANLVGAPALQFQRSKVDRGQYGSIRRLGNKSNDFVAWFREIVMWIQANTKLVKRPYKRHFFADAWRVYLSLHNDRKNWAVSPNAW